MRTRFTRRVCNANSNSNTTRLSLTTKAKLASKFFSKHTRTQRFSVHGTTEWGNPNPHVHNSLWWYFASTSVITYFHGQSQTFVRAVSCTDNFNFQSPSHSSVRYRVRITWTSTVKFKARLFRTVSRTGTSALFHRSTQGRNSSHSLSGVRAFCP